MYRGSDAFIMCFWALEKYSGWAKRFSSPALKPYARAMFDLVSSKRHLFANVLSKVDDTEIASRLAVVAQSPRCDDGSCNVEPSGAHSQSSAVVPR